MGFATTSKLILVMLLWAVCFPLILAGIGSAPHLSFATLRALLAATVLLALTAILGRRFPRDLRVWALLALSGFGATSLGFLGMFHAAEFISPGVATVIANTQPLMAAVLAHAFLDERLDARAKTGLALGFAGIVLIAVPRLLAPGAATYAVGVAYIGLAALGITGSNVLLKRLAGRVDPLVAMGIQLAFGSVPLAIAAGLTEIPAAIDWSPTFVIVLLALALPGTALVYWLWFSLLAALPLNRANAFSFLIPVFGLAMGVGLFGESLGGFEIIGVTLTLIGLARVIRGSSENRTVQTQAARGRA